MNTDINISDGERRAILVIAKEMYMTADEAAEVLGVSRGYEKPPTGRHYADKIEILAII